MKEPELIKDTGRCLKIEFMPQYPGSFGSDIENVEYYVTFFLCNFRPFYDFVVETRKELLDSTEPFDYPTSNEEPGSVVSQAKLEEFLAQLESDQQRGLERAVGDYIWEHKLGSRWRLSISVAVLTHHFPVPPQWKFSQCIHLRPSLEYIEREEFDRESTDKYVQGTCGVVQRYPGIYFTGAVNRSELREWLKGNKKAFEKLMGTLPARGVTRLEERTEKVALVTLICLNAGCELGEVEEEINELEQRYFEENGESAWEKDGKVLVPDEEEIRNSLSSYKDVILRLFSP